MRHCSGEAGGPAGNRPRGIDTAAASAENADRSPTITDHNHGRLSHVGILLQSMLIPPRFYEGDECSLETCWTVDRQAVPSEARGDCDEHAHTFSARQRLKNLSLNSGAGALVRCCACP